MVQFSLIYLNCTIRKHFSVFCVCFYVLFLYQLGINECNVQFYVILTFFHNVIYEASLYLFLSQLSHTVLKLITVVPIYLLSLCVHLQN